MAAQRSKKRTTSKTAARGAKKPAKTSAKKAAAKKAAPRKPAAKKASAPAKKPAKTSARPAKKAAVARRPAAAIPTSIQYQRLAAASSPKSAPGSFSRLVWFDLMTRDLPLAKDFYTSVFGWNAKDGNVPSAGAYIQLSSDGTDFGGIAPLQDPNMPSNWLPYIVVSNVESTIGKAQELGGKVIVPPMEIPTVGRFSVIMDPTGGVVAPIHFNQTPNPPPGNGNVLGPVRYSELVTDDPDTALPFYEQLFGWTHVNVPDPVFPFSLLLAGSMPVGGVFKRPPPIPATQWLTYFQVPGDVATAHQAALGKGSKELFPPSEVPGVGRFSWLLDPQGALLALFQTV